MPRQPVKRQAIGARQSDSASLPAPIDGINARDALGLMKPTDAVDMENLFPTPTDVRLRNGWSGHATFTGAPETIVPYNGATARKLFAAIDAGAENEIRDITSAGAAGAVLVGGAADTVQALTSTRFDYINVTTTGGNFLLLWNGADVPLEYDGTTWTASASTGVGLTTSNLFTGGVYGNRVWALEKNTFNAWYLAAGTKSGAFTKLPLGVLFKKGGALACMVTLTDASAEAIDYVGFVSTEGEVVAFMGDVADADSWTLAAQMQVGRPVTNGNRAWCKWGTDALLVCADGVLPLRKAVAADNRDRALSVSDRIAPLVNEDVALHGARFGWQLVVHPTGNKLILNVPTAELSDARQWVMNTRHQRWTKFTGWKAFCMEVVRDHLYLGMTGKVVKADSDSDLSDGGASIFFKSKQAHNYFGARGDLKLAGMMQPTFAVDGTMQITVGVDANFGKTTLPPLTTLAGSAGDPWGGIWDVAWSGALTVQGPWFSLVGEGYCFAPRVEGVSGDSRFRWTSSLITMTKGQGVGL